jgi:hypothetical protein
VLSGGVFIPLAQLVFVRFYQGFSNEALTLPIRPRPLMVVILMKISFLAQNGINHSR